MVAGDQLILMWAPSPGAAKYRVYQNGKQVVETESFQQVLKLPAEGGKYSFYVVAVDKKGNEGEKGRKYEHTVRKMEKVKDLLVLVQEKRIAIRWSPVSGALIYDVQRGTAPEGPFELLTSTQNQSFVDSKVKDGVSYYYRVAAKDTTGALSGYSDPVLGKLEEAGATSEVPLQIRKAKLEWAFTGIQNIEECLYLSESVVLCSSPTGDSGPLLYLLKNPGKPYQEKTLIPPPIATGEGEIKRPVRFYGLGKGRDGSAYVANGLSPVIYKVDPDSRQITDEIVVPQLPKTKTPYAFVDVAEGPQGELYLVEKTNDMVVVVKGEKAVLSFGNHGTQPGQFLNPSRILVHNGEVYVTDSVQNNITVFGIDGKLIRRFGKTGGRDPGTFSRLSGIAIDEERNWLYAGDFATSQIQIMDLEGNFVAMLSNEKGDGGLQTTPSGLAVLGDHILVAWKNGERAQEFRFLGPPEERK
jgi:hypothetical protein